MLQYFSPGLLSRLGLSILSIHLSIHLIQKFHLLPGVAAFLLPLLLLIRVRCYPLQPLLSLQQPGSNLFFFIDSLPVSASELFFDFQSISFNSVLVSPHCEFAMKLPLTSSSVMFIYFVPVCPLFVQSYHCCELRPSPLKGIVL